MKYFISTILFFIALNVKASVIYDFEGICSEGCTGIATGILTLADTYTPGTQVADSDFISFSYSSSSGSFEIPSDLALNRIHNSVLPTASETSVAWVEIDAILSGTGLNACGIDTLTDYQCPSDWAWSAEWVPGGITRDLGLSYTWTLQAVPVPAAVWLFGSGLIGLIGLARRKADA